jgi:hypothetical protein
LVSALGGHSDVFANRLRAPDPDWGQALRLAMPSVIVIGIEALRQAGWTTQIPARPDVAVDASAPVYTVEPFTVSTRPTQWFENVLKSGLQPRPGLSGLPVLRPAWALADLLATAGWGACGLAPDDIDWEEADAQDRADWDMACAVFGFRPASTDFP